MRKKILNNINALKDNQIIIQSLNDELANLHNKINEYKKAIENIKVKKDPKKEGLPNKEIKEKQNNKIDLDHCKIFQIVSFSNIYESYKDYEKSINSFLKNNNHLIIKKNKQGIDFTVNLKDSESAKVMIRFVSDLNIEYEGIELVNNYLIVIDFDN